MSDKSGSATPGLRPCKRYIATHDSNGKSVYAESPDQSFNMSTAGGPARSYAVDSVPAKLADDADVKAYQGTEAASSHSKKDIVVPNGANLVVFDLKPGASSQMHRTVSIDYSICVIGEIDHELDGGEKVRLLPGDHIVQRGTMHRWSNPSKTEPARAIACTIACEPFDIAGEQLKQVFVPGSEAKL